MKRALTAAVAGSIAAGALVAGSIVAFAGQEKAAPAAKPSPTVKKAAAKKPSCPIMNHEVAKPDPKMKSVYNGKSVYFCCAGCKPAFEGKPAAEKAKLAAKFGVDEKPAAGATKKPAAKKPA